MSETNMADEDHLLRLVKKIAAEQNFETYDVKVTPVSSGGANYTSRLYSIKVTEKSKDDLNLFAKVAIFGENIRDQTHFDPFVNEGLVYTNLFVAYREIEEKHGVNEEHRLRFSKYYGADTTRLQEVLVLENLTSRGFQSANRFISVDWPYTVAAITELAKLHALSFVYQHKYPIGFKNIVKTFPTDLFQENEMFEGMFNQSITSALTAVREENKEKLKHFFDATSFASYNGMIKALRHEVIIHMDFRPSNMLHKLKEDGTTEVIPVDYQTVQVGSPTFDLMYFIFTATDKKFRDEHYQGILDHYHSELGAALARFGLEVEDIFSRNDFESEIKQKLPAGLLMAVMLLPVLTVPEDEAPELNDTLDAMESALCSNTDLYRQRLNEVVDDYVGWGVL